MYTVLGMCTIPLALMHAPRPAPAALAQTLPVTATFLGPHAERPSECLRYPNPASPRPCISLAQPPPNPASFRSISPQPNFSPAEIQKLEFWVMTSLLARAHVMSN